MSAGRRSGVLAVLAATLFITGIAGIAVAMTHMGRDMMGMMQGGQSGRSAPAPVSGAPVLPVTATEFAFRPGLVRVQVNQTVNIELINGGGMFHTLTVSDTPFELRAPAGERISGAFRATRPGSYGFICSVPGHAQAGMRGTITVT